MNPTALKLGADMVAGDPALQMGAGAGLLVAIVCGCLLAALVLYAIGYQRSDNS